MKPLTLLLGIFCLLVRPADADVTLTCRFNVSSDAILRLSAKPGDEMAFDAKGSSDPDGISGFSANPICNANKLINRATNSANVVGKFISISVNGFQIPVSIGPMALTLDLLALITPNGVPAISRWLSETTPPEQEFLGRQKK